MFGPPLRSGVAAAFLLATGACGAWSGAGPGCTPLARPSPLPEGLQESSGVAFSRLWPGSYWTVTDGGGPFVHRVTGDGRLLATVRLDVVDHDWEDLAIAPCGDGHCLWIADTGDNRAARDSVVLYRVPERALSPPSPGAEPVSADAFPLRLPDGPRDIEALFVTPEGRVVLVSKGDRAPVSVYALPLPLVPGVTVRAEEVQRLGKEPRSLPGRITGAGSAPEGRIVALRTYETLHFHRVDVEGRLTPLEDGRVDLRSLREAQGEAVALGPDGGVVLTSEAGPLARFGSIVEMRCTVPDAPEG